jgi:glutaconate CoA-transferase subunit A
MTRAAKQVFVVSEKLDSIESFQQRPELTLVPSFMVQAMSIVPNGAWPGSCWPLYEVDYPAVEEYMDTAGSLDAHMAKAPEIAERAHA